MRICPRDQKLLRAATLGEAFVDVCGKCGGTFFDSEDLIAAAGAAADPASWDRAETGARIKPSDLSCPNCATTMDAQDVTHQGKDVEIDRCGKCRGIWLDKGELDVLAAIGKDMLPIVEAARAKAKKELEDLEKGGVDFKKRSPIEQRRFLATMALLVMAIAGIGYYAYVATRPPPPRSRVYEDNKEGGCPCGCDHSKAMAAELRAKDDAAALASIEETLVTIGRREDAGYITERMVQHRLRMLDVAAEIHARRPGRLAGLARLGVPCNAPRVEADGLRVCSDLAAHGERIELVNGEDKLITSSFRLWLEIENVGGEPRTLATPTIVSSSAHLPVTRWYIEGTSGQPWNGRIGAHETVRVNVIGDIPGHVLPGTKIDATIAIGALFSRTTTEARQDIHLRRL